eukprot:TRINITY_DN5888_c0_g1_i1.p1 TRINITY_DN5888_c0_g1~~TRINITY_DN5888_c0_g1_i1.p1  ORF type:complete len:263 (+),score=70.61 TRINITY_DN5888_c0_g1_i1:361-1149(+)
MSAAVCGKRSLFEDVHGSSPVASSKKRLRFTSPFSRADQLSALFALFPSMDPQIVERTFDACDESMDDAIKSLQNLCLDLSHNSIPDTTANNLLNSEGQTAQALPGSIPTPDADANNHDVRANMPSDGAKWVELLVTEMTNASDLDDARVRAMRILEAFEKAVISKSVETPELLQKDHSFLKEQMQQLLQENTVLKRAVAIQHERQLDYEEKAKELNHLRQLVTQYQEQVRKLELNNYALTIHLKRAEEGSSMPGRFHPDVF